MQKFLNENNIETGLHYPVPLHLQNAYKHLGYKVSDFEVCCSDTKKILSLPMYPELESDKIEYVCSKIKEFHS